MEEICVLCWKQLKWLFVWKLRCLFCFASSNILRTLPLEMPSDRRNWRLRHQFQKASLIPASSARPHQNVNLILNLDTLLFLPFEWGTQRWSSTESASSETGQLTMIIFLQDYFSSVIGWSRGIVFLSLSTPYKLFSGGKKGNKK